MFAVLWFLPKGRVVGSLAILNYKWCAGNKEQIVRGGKLNDQFDLQGASMNVIGPMVAFCVIIRNKLNIPGKRQDCWGLTSQVLDKRHKENCWGLENVLGILSWHTRKVLGNRSVANSSLFEENMRNPGNYWQVSLTSAVRMLLERIHSYLDTNKAFAKVPHSTVIQKITMHGIQGDLVVWIQNWITHRRKRLVVEGCCSRWRSVTSSAVQASYQSQDLCCLWYIQMTWMKM